MWSTDSAVCNMRLVSVSCYQLDIAGQCGVQTSVENCYDLGILIHDVHVYQQNLAFLHACMHACMHACIH